MKNLIDFLKQLLLIIWLFAFDFFKTYYSTFITKLIKIFIISTIIYSFINFIPNNLTIFHNLNLLDWMLSICIFNLFLIKYDDFDINDEMPDISNNDDVEKEDIKKEPSSQYDEDGFPITPISLNQIKKEKGTQYDTSTRE